MENLRILNKKESERILEKIKEQFGIDKIDFDYKILQNKKGKIFLISRDISKIDLSRLRINELGLYIARLDKELRLTIEGSQIFGKYATKNIYKIDDEQENLWLNGNDLSCDKIFNGFVIIKHDGDFLGSGKWKDSKILNYIPMERRIKIKNEIINI